MLKVFAILKDMTAKCDLNITIKEGLKKLDLLDKNLEQMQTPNKLWLSPVPQQIARQPLLGLILKVHVVLVYQSNDIENICSFLYDVHIDCAACESTSETY